MKRRLLSLALTLALVLALLPASVLADGNTGTWTDSGNYDTSWYNTTDTDFTVSTAAQLAGLAVLVNGGNDFTGKTVTLTADVDLSGHNWTPIGDRRPISSNVYAEFAGVFDGGRHSIKNMTVNSGNGFGGLFGLLYGKVKNVSVSGSVSATNESVAFFVGGIAGENHGTIENCTNAGTVTGGSFAGGIAGENVGTIANCSNAGTATGGNETGGIAGANSGTITNCSNTGTVTGSLFTGGIAGSNYGTITNCSNAGTVTKSLHTGGIAGNNNLGSITNCYWLVGTADRIVDEGGNPVINCASFTEEQGKGTETSPSFSYTIGDVTTDSTTLLAALNAYVKANDDTSLKYWKQPSGSYPVFCETWSEALAVKGTVDISDHNIDNAWDLAQLAKAVNDGAAQSGVTYTQTADIDLGLYNWRPIGDGSYISNYMFTTFAGTFDGGGKSIKIAASGQWEMGLFGYSTGTIKRVSLSGSVEHACIENNDNMPEAAGIVGINYGLIESCSNAAAISIKSSFTGPSPKAGGIVGINSGTVKNCVNTGRIYVNTNCDSCTYAGGIAGSNLRYIINCYNTGDVYAISRNAPPGHSSYAGGIVGNDYGDGVLNCYSTGKSIADNGRISGGIAGEETGSENASPPIANCYWLTGSDLPKLLYNGDGEYSDCGTFGDAKGALTLYGSQSGDKLAADTLLDALNAWVDAQNDLSLDGWRVAAGVNGGYPVLRERHTVTFDVNGGDSLKANTSVVVNGDAYGALPVPTRSGYRFDGWFTAKTGGTQVQATDTVSLTANATLYARWSYTPPLKVNLTFDTNGGSAVTGAAVTIGTKPDLSGFTTTKKGFRFGGWFLDKALTQQADGAAVTRDTTLYAKWLPMNLFTDVSGSEWFADALDWAVENGIVNGVTPTTFGPGLTGTRAQVLAMLWRASGSPDVSGASPFSDVQDPGAWYYKAVLWAAQKGAAQGYEGKFNPDRPITRAELITLLWRLAGSPEPKGQANPFTDVAQKDYYYKAVLWAHENGIAQGMKPTAFDPAGPCTRAQLVTFLWRYFSK